MKNKCFIFVILISFFFSLFIPQVQAQSIKEIYLNESIPVEERIEIIEKEIARLLSLIKKIEARNELKGKINAESFLIVNLSDNSTLIEKNSKYFYPIASITKLMSAVIVLENINLEKEIVLTNNMLRPPEIPLLSRYGQSPSIFPGLTINAESLLKASLIQSTNAANQALTHFLGQEKFIKLMNEKAEELEMKNTFFNDSHGLSSLNSSTVHDLAKLMEYIYKNHPEILETTKNNDFQLPDAWGRMLSFKNVNNFHENESFIGGKTGYLTVAGQTFASIFKAKEDFFSIILLKSRNRQSDISKILDWLNS